MDNILPEAPKLQKDMENWVGKNICIYIYTCIYICMYTCMNVYLYIVPIVSIVVPFFGLTTFSFRILKRKVNTVENIGNSDFRQQPYDLFNRDVLHRLFLF